MHSDCSLTSCSYVDTLQGQSLIVIICFLSSNQHTSFYLSGIELAFLSIFFLRWSVEKRKASGVLSCEEQSNILKCSQVTPFLSSLRSSANRSRQPWSVNLIFLSTLFLLSCYVNCLQPNMEVSKLKAVHYFNLSEAKSCPESTNCGDNTECVVDLYFPKEPVCRCKIGFRKDFNTGKCVGESLRRL